MSEDTLGRVIQVLAEAQKISSDSVSPDSTFEQLGIDSVDALNILFAIENEFGINVPDEAARGIRTVRDLADGVESLLASRKV